MHELFWYTGNIKNIVIIKVPITDHKSSNKKLSNERLKQLRIIKKKIYAA